MTDLSRLLYIILFSCTTLELYYIRRRRWHRERSFICRDGDGSRKQWPEEMENPSWGTRTDTNRETTTTKAECTTSKDDKSLLRLENSCYLFFYFSCEFHLKLDQSIWLVFTLRRCVIYDWFLAVIDGQQPAPFNNLSIDARLSISQFSYRITFLYGFIFYVLSFNCTWDRGWGMMIKEQLQSP